MTATDNPPGQQSTWNDRFDADEFEEEHPDDLAYQALSRAAVLSLAFAFVGSMGLFFPSLLLCTLVGLVCGIVALRSIRRYPEELTGKGLAKAGIALCSLLLVGGVTMHSLTYAFEVPEGYDRISFRELQPSKEAPNIPIPPRALELDGEHVFLRGYIHPGDGKRANLKKFVLVPDRGTCCFGGVPKPTDMIEVTLPDPLRARYSYSVQKLAGVLRVDTTPRPIKDLGGVFYRLDAHYLNSKKGKVPQGQLPPKETESTTEVSVTKVD